MVGKERVIFEKRFLIQFSPVVFCIFELCCVTELRAVGIKKLLQLFFTLQGFTKEAAVADFLYITGHEIDGQRETILQFEKLGGVVAEMAFIVNLPDVGGYKKLKDRGYNVFCLTEFEGD